MPKKRIDEERLLRIALEEFSKYSYEEASVNRIIADAGITKGSFYYRFSNKYELYLDLLKQGIQKKWEFINSDPDAYPGSGTDIFDLFQAQAESGVRFALAYPGYHQIGKMFSKEKGNPVYRQAIKDLNASDESSLKQHIAGAYRDGNFKEEYSPDFIEKIITSLFTSFDEILFRDEDFELERAMSYLGEFVSFLKYGLKKT